MMRPNKGFTLVETLVALVIAGLVSYLVFNTLQVSSNSSQRLVSHLGNYHLMKRSQDWFRFSVQGILVQKNYLPHFVGDSQSFSAYTNYSITSRVHKLQRVTWMIEADETGSRLLISEGENGSLVEVYRWPSDISDLRFQYIDHELTLFNQWSRGELLRVLPEAVVVSSESADVMWIVNIWSDKLRPLDLEQL